MPGSSPRGKEWTKAVFQRLRKNIRFNDHQFHITDVGPGEGTYSALLRDKATDIWTAIEVFYPYVEKYKLVEKYDRVIISDVRYYDWYSLPAVQDVIIFGDVLEHMMKHEALSVLNKARERAVNILVSLPIGRCPQGTIEGNPYEQHKDSWGHEEFITCSRARESNLDGNIGTYLI